MSARKPAAAPVVVEVVAILSDLHVAIIDPVVLDLCKQWVRDVRPKRMLLNGDVLDLADFSVYPKGVNPIECAVDEIKSAVAHVNGFLQHTDSVVWSLGNHESRWSRMIGGADARKFHGAKGLTLEDQLRAHGLDPEVRMFNECAATPALELCRGVYARHGDRQSGRFGGAVNIATNRLNKGNGVSEVVGHHHRAQIAYRSGLDRQAFVMALPTMAKAEDYAPGADWQRGWAALTIVRRGSKVVHVQPDLIIPTAGVATWGGRAWHATPPAAQPVTKMPAKAAA